MKAPVLGSFQGRISVAALHCAFSWHYLSELSESPALPLFATYSDPPIVMKPSLSRLLGGVDVANYSTYENQAGTDSDPILPPSEHALL